jgi:hypothetical protein
MIVEEGARCCCCVHISCSSCIEFLAYFTTFISGISSLIWYKHPPDPSMSHVQINPLVPTSTPGWIPTDPQSESRGPYFDPRSQPARPCATCRFLGHGSTSPRIKAGLKPKKSQQHLKMFAVVPWIEPHRICDITKSHEAITSRVPESSRPQPTSNSTVSTTIALGTAPSQAQRLPQPFATPMEMLKQSLPNPVRFAPLHSDQLWA